MPSIENIVDLLGLAEECQRRNLHFALYRMPHEKNRHLVLQQSPTPYRIEPLEPIATQSGFVFTAFPGSSMPRILIQPDFVLADDNITEEALISILRKTGFSQNGFKRPHPQYTSREAFCNMVERALDEIRSGKIKKVVLSRPHPHAIADGWSSIAVFDRLEKLYPEAFVFLVNLPQIGQWIGATPELLLTLHNQTLKTVALAGTKQTSPDQDFDWGTKDMEEQKMVADYIYTTLRKFFGENIHMHGPATVKAGPLEHLETSFTIPFKAERITDTFDALLNEMHPTPAVGGLPKQQALQLIHKLEGYDRAYYSGYLGPVNLQQEHSIQLFVNLRCLEVLYDGLVLYVGAGITADSNPLAEWEETEWKAQTLLKAL
ncbi:MAG: hypothetical protein KatS3mg031_3028 [Chitinophagales bacterium]|nr:MAG: hypothetical protein KatS3mg031_3028 [Chitinophagales bacterium]